MENEDRVWDKASSECSYVLQYLGAYASPREGLPWLISPWMKNGTSEKFLKENLDRDLLDFVSVLFQIKTMKVLTLYMIYQDC